MTLTQSLISDDKEKRALKEENIQIKKLQVDNMEHALLPAWFMTFNNVQRIRASVRRYPDGWGEAHSLTGLMRWADCGKKMYVHRIADDAMLSSEQSRIKLS